MSLRGFIHSAGLLSGLAALLAPGSAAAQGVPGTAVLLPVAKGVGMRWVMGPLLRPGGGESMGAAPVFAVDAQGRPWLGDGKREAASPTQNLAFSLDLPYDDFTFTGEGDLVFSSRDTLGMALPGAKARFTKNGLPVLALKPLVKAPLSHFHLYPAPHGLYLAGPAAQGDFELYYLDASRKGHAVFRELLRSAAPILAVAGDGRRVYVSVGKLVLSLKQGDRTAATGFFKAGRAVTGLALVDGAGLFYATARGGGYVDLENRKSLEFFAAREPRIFGWDGALYIYVSQVQGVSRLDGAGQFKRLLGG